MVIQIAASDKTLAPVARYSKRENPMYIFSNLPGLLIGLGATEGVFALSGVIIGVIVALIIGISFLTLQYTFRRHFYQFEVTLEHRRSTLPFLYNKNRLGRQRCHHMHQSRIAQNILTFTDTVVISFSEIV